MRQAIRTADGSNSPGPDTIDFNIPGNGPFVIQPATPLPAVSRPTVIDGYSQPGAYVNTLAVGDNAVLQIQLQGPGGFNGLNITGGGSTVRGLSIDGFNSFFTPDTGIAVSSRGGNIIEGDFLGTQTDGNTPAENGYGLVISGSNGNTVGGTDPASRNVISANGTAQVFVDAGSTGNVLEGDYIGTNRTGGTGLGGYGVTGVLLQDAPGNTIGGNVAGAGNVISGNGQDGITVGYASTTTGSPDTVIQGNIIGLDATGSVALGEQNGIVINAGANCLIGGTDPLARNLISGNSIAGVSINLNNAPDTVSGETIQGNDIGTDDRGLGAIGNGVGISIQSATSELIGGTTPGAGNLISGNNGPGIEDQNSRSTPGGNTIQGNLIGTDGTGTHPLGNGRTSNTYTPNSGILLNGTSDLVGGTTPAPATSSRATWGTASRSNPRPATPSRGT